MLELSWHVLWETQVGISVFCDSLIGAVRPLSRRIPSVLVQIHIPLPAFVILQKDWQLPPDDGYPHIRLPIRYPANQRGFHCC